MIAYRGISWGYDLHQSKHCNSQRLSSFNPNRFDYASNDLSYSNSYPWLCELLLFSGGHWPLSWAMRIKIASWYTCQWMDMGVKQSTSDGSRLCVSRWLHRARWTPEVPYEVWGGGDNWHVSHNILLQGDMDGLLEMTDCIETWRI